MCKYFDGEKGENEDDDDAKEDLQILRVFQFLLLVALEYFSVRFDMLGFLSFGLLDHFGDILFIRGWFL
jgi:hypothetical protein